MDMAVVLITEATLMPDTKVSVVDKDAEEKDEDIVSEILEDLMKDMKGSPSANSTDLEKTFMNSMVVEVKVDNPPKQFKINLFMKPFIDIVSKKATCRA